VVRVPLSDFGRSGATDALCALVEALGHAECARALPAGTVPMEDALGPNLVSKVDGAKHPTASVLATARCVGLFSAHVAQTASQDAAEQLRELLASVNAPTGEGESKEAEVIESAFPFVVVVLPQDSSPSDSAILEGVEGAFTLDCDSLAAVGEVETNLRKMFGLSMAVVIPELLLWSTDGRLISTDGIQQLGDGMLQPERFPHDWQSNVLTLEAVADPMFGYTAFASEGTLLRCKLYPGDPVSVRALTSGRVVSLTVQQAKSGDRSSKLLQLPRATLLGSGLELSEAVILERLGEPPTAVTVSVRPYGAVSTEQIREYFGLSERESVDARLTHAEELLGESVPPWLLQHVRRSDCRFAVVARGQHVFWVHSPVEVAPTASREDLDSLAGVLHMEVVATTPAGSVVVGPDTELCVV
jgi:hypothetical protein